MPFPGRFFIEGFDDRNWGDVLMATASINLAQELSPGAEIVLARKLPYSSSAEKSIFGSAIINSEYSGKPRWNIFLKKRGPFDITYRARNAKSGDTILFCNGYIFGDPWSTRWLARLAKTFVKLNKRGVKIILMPQSLGPFDRSDRHEIFSQIFRSVSLVLARDGRSMDFLRGLHLDLIHARQSIDYTGMLNSNRAFQLGKVKHGRICIIPNVKITEKYGEVVSKRYIDILAEIASRAHLTHGLQVALIHHTAGKDITLISDLKRKLPFTVLEHYSDPLETRKFIGESEFVISSRFHGVMNALTQNVPVISIGWSHKYSEIMSHYGMEKFSIIGPDLDNVQKSLDYMIHRRSNIVERLQSVNETVNIEHFEPLKDSIRTTLQTE